MCKIKEDCLYEIYRIEEKINRLPMKFFYNLKASSPKVDLYIQGIESLYEISSVINKL